MEDNHMNRPYKPESPLKTALTASTISGALRELIRSFGYDPDRISSEDLQGVADRLSRIAGKEPAWGWRYLHNILMGKLDSSEKLTQAIMALGASFDGIPLEVAASRPVTVQALGNVRPGALVFGDSRPCSNPACPVEFIPRAWNHRFCTPACRKRFLSRKKDARIKGS
jgi:hypothetical protein